MEHQQLKKIQDLIFEFETLMQERHVDLKVSTNIWLWEGLIQEGAFNLVVALSKVGKSSLIAAFLGAKTKGEPDYCGKKINSKSRPIILGGNDQQLEY